MLEPGAIIDSELRGESMPEEEITINDFGNEDNGCVNESNLRY